jgi:hypothetical protein
MRWREGALVAFVALASCAAARAQDATGPAVVAQGRALLDEHKCNGSCHQSYSEDNDPLTLYTRADRKVRDRRQLDAQVRRCVASLGSMMFPEEIQSVGAALDADFYKFGKETGEHGR